MTVANQNADHTMACSRNLGHGFVEITIFETEVPPRFRLSA